MTKAQRSLYEEISRLPPEKVEIVHSFIQNLEQESDIVLDVDEITELQQILQADKYVDSNDLLASIHALPND